MKFAGIFPILTFLIQMLTAPVFAQEKPPQDAQAKERPQCAQDDKRPECARQNARPSRYSPPVTVDLVPSPPLPRSSQSPSSAPSSMNSAVRAPAAVNSCDAGGCWDAGGNRYHGGIGDTYLDSRGRQCRRSGTWMQCN